MVSDQPTPTVGSVDGAPPVPPPGGYRGASRLRARTVAAQPPPPEESSKTPSQRQGLAWLALVSSVIFALVLLVLAVNHAVSAIFSTTALVAQVLLIGLIVTALMVSRPRTVAAASVAVAVLLNVGTIGALAAATTPAPGTDGAIITEEERFWRAYPGVKNTYGAEVADLPSLEDRRAEAADILDEVRAALSARFGYDWVSGVPERVDPLRNGYGGQSMLSVFTSAEWVSTEPISDLDRKYDVLDVVEQVVEKYGYSTLYSINGGASGLTDDELTTRFGSTDPAKQVEWQSVAVGDVDGAYFVVGITDLTKDTTGVFRAKQEAIRAGTGAPPDGISLALRTEPVLPAADQAEYSKRISQYP